MEKYFRASWDTNLKLLTGFCSFILIVVMVYESTLASTVLILLIFFICACFGVNGYSISEKVLLIHRLGWVTRIDLNKLDNAKYDPNVTVGSIRVWGIGGLFGYVGYFRNSALGKYKAYTTNTKNTLMLEVSNKTIVISPDFPKEFVEAIQSTIETN